jgi:hypothetical protein
VFGKGVVVTVHGGTYTVKSVHGNGKTLKVTDGIKDFFKKAADCKLVMA